MPRRNESDKVAQERIPLRPGEELLHALHQLGELDLFAPEVPQRRLEGLVLVWTEAALDLDDHGEASGSCTDVH